MSEALNRPASAAAPVRGARAISRELMAAAGLTLVAVTYQRLLHARLVNLGATPDEVAAHVPGDVLPLRPSDPGMRVAIFDPERAMSSRFEDGNWVWSFALTPENGSTRLLSRNGPRVRTKGERAGIAAMEIGSLVMERRMLRGIKQRAERIGRGIS